MCECTKQQGGEVDSRIKGCRFIISEKVRRFKGHLQERKESTKKRN